MILALIAGPHVDLGEDMPETLLPSPIVSRTLPEPEYAVSLQSDVLLPEVISQPVSMDGSIFINPPSRVTMPLMPDIPEPVHQIEPVQAPLFAALAAPDPLLSSLVVSTKNVDAAMGDGQRQGRILGDALNVRVGPAKRHPSVARLRRGDVVEVVGRVNGGWVPIALEGSDQVGWVFQRYIELL
ncbi:SH3 domain-containing protein [Candidatus Rhodobacter oscarellae]|nr:SH3 domain-containing protein [Candidatus Rhodobacter lobularis]